MNRTRVFQTANPMRACWIAVARSVGVLAVTVWFAACQQPAKPRTYEFFMEDGLAREGVLALLIVHRRPAVLVAARENAFPGEAVFHEKLVRPRLRGLLAGREPNRDREHAGATGDSGPASTHWIGRLRHARSDSSVTSKRAYVSVDGALSPNGQFTNLPKNPDVGARGRPEPPHPPRRR